MINLTVCRYPPGYVGGGTSNAGLVKVEEALNSPAAAAAAAAAAATPTNTLILLLLLLIILLLY